MELQHLKLKMKFLKLKKEVEYTFYQKSNIGLETINLEILNLLLFHIPLLVVIELINLNGKIQINIEY